MSDHEMTMHEMTSLGIGDVVISTDDLETYPTYWIEGGARFVVVTNTLAQERNGLLSLRLAPADKGKLTTGDLSEWCDAVEVYDPATEGGVDHEPGVDPSDRAAPGNAWSLTTVAVRPTPDALTLTERVAAVFTQRLFEVVDREGIREIARREAAETDPRICHGNDLCDANMLMLATFQAMDLPTPLDALDDPSLGDGPEALWNDAWSLAMREWLPVAPSPEDDPEANPTISP